MDKHVALPIYLRDGIRPLKRGFPQRIKLFTFDTETDYGEPYLLIFNDGNHVSTVKVDKNTVLDRFIGYLLKHCNSNKHTHILFCHNLSFDLPAVLTQVEHQLFLRKNSIFRYLSDPETREAIAEIKLFTNKSWFAQISLKNNATIKVVDSANFLRGKLYDLSRALNLQYKKRKPPPCVEQGKKPQTKTEWAKLYRYCFDESKAEYELAKYVLNMHWQYDVTLSVSAPHLASKIFRKCFLSENIPQIPEHIRKLAESTIHGGRAAVFVNTPIPIPNVSMYDYNSFYPYSMANLPGLTKGEWKPVKEFVSDHEGFYYVSGYVKQCQYPIIIKSTSKMEYANGEQISNVPINSYELKEALSCNELEPSKIFGYIWVPHADSKKPFKPYVEYFYAQKERYPKNSPLNTQPN